MPKREILLIGHPTLRAKAKRVTNITAEIAQLVEDMKDTMAEEGGVGLAAPQVGARVRAIAVRRDITEDDEVFCLLNPRIVACEGEQEGTEGCLSLPTLQGIVVRTEKVVAEGMSLEGERIRIEGEGLFARALEHEIDHLDGTLLVDRVEEGTLGWMVPDEDEEFGYRLEPTSVEEAVEQFERLRKRREGQQ